MLLGGGTVATPSPGSFFAMLVLTPKGAMLGNLVGFFAGMAVSFIIAAVLLKLDKRPETIDGTESVDTHSANNANSEVLNTQGARNIEKIIVACDAGMGSSAMGASVLKTKLKKAMIDIKVANAKIEEIPSDTDLVITHIQLIDRAKKLHGDKGITFMSITNFIEGSQYDEIVEYIKNNKISR